jgi:hypothetical protein
MRRNLLGGKRSAGLAIRSHQDYTPSRIPDSCQANEKVEIFIKVFVEVVFKNIKEPH